MPYQTRPRYQARIDRRSTPRAETPRAENRSPRATLRPPRWESTPVLDALTEMHNAPVRRPTER